MAVAATLGDMFLGYWMWGVVAAGVAICWWWRVRSGANAKGVPPGSMGWPFVGQTLNFLTKHERYMQSSRSRYGSIFKSFLFGDPTVVSTDAEMNKFILQSTGKLFTMGYPKSVNDMLGKFNMLAINGDLHKKMRAITLGFMNAPALREHWIHEIESLMRSSLKSWEGRTVNTNIETRAISLGLVAGKLFGCKPGKDRDELVEYFDEFLEGVFSVPINVPGTNYWKGMKARNGIVKKLLQIINERRHQPHKTHNDLIDALVENDDPLTEHQMVDLLVSLLFAGHESTSTTMTMILYYLNKHPEVLQELRVKCAAMQISKLISFALVGLQKDHMEIRESKKPGENITWEDCKKMQFTQHVINEAIRLMNIVNAVYRRAVKDIDFKGHRIPAGWRVMVYFRSNHLNDTHFPNPKEFNPWRWQKRKDAFDDYFTPFGGGIRLCPGMELARLEVSIFLHYIAIGYSWKPVGEDEVVYFPSVKMMKGFPIAVTPL